MPKFTVQCNENQITIGNHQYSMGSSLLSFIGLPITDLQNDFYNYVDRLVTEHFMKVENYKKVITTWFDTIDDFHPYCSLLSVYFNRCIKLFNSMVNESTTPEELANNLKKTFYTIVLDFLECKKIYTNLLNACFFYPQMPNELTPSMHYFLFKSMPQTKFKDISLNYTVVPSKKINQANMIDSMRTQQIGICKSYTISNINQLCYIEFMYLLEKTPMIKVCNKCQNYFIPIYADDDVCYRKGFGKLEPCSELVKQQVALEKQVADSFEDVYQKYTALVGLSQITRHDLSNWVQNSRHAQKLCLEHKITFDQYYAIISEIRIG